MNYQVIVPIKSSMRVNRWVINQALEPMLFVYASFDFEEPVIHGFGITEVAARVMATQNGTPISSLVLCSRSASRTETFWQGAQGQIVRPDHFRGEVERKKASWQ
jgi:hypothetical protein